MDQRDRMYGSSADPLATKSSQSEALPVLLRQSLSRVLADERYDDSDEAELRMALRDTCERARRDGVRAEHLLIVLKKSWRDLPERTRLPRVEADEALTRVVSACIDEYYQDERIREWVSSSRGIQEADRIQGLSSSAEVQ